MQIVPFVLIGNKYASLSIDLVKHTTLLIHPTESCNQPETVLEEFKPLCMRLTAVALHNLNALTLRRICDIDWNYEVALQHEHPIEPYDTNNSENHRAVFIWFIFLDFLSSNVEHAFCAEYTLMYAGTTLELLPSSTASQRKTSSWRGEKHFRFTHRYF
jgi:hypothetical protein